MTQSARTVAMELLKDSEARNLALSSQLTTAASDNQRLVGELKEATTESTELNAQDIALSNQLVNAEFDNKRMVDMLKAVASEESKANADSLHRQLATSYTKNELLEEEKAVASND
jgi:septal ring factor EnvC (AmiA/AmiB activator)